MSMHRFDLEEASQEASDRLEAESLKPVSLLEDLLFWLVVVVGTAVGLYATLVLSEYLMPWVLQ